MILCKNGHPNEDGATYCVVCKVYIDATAQAVAPAPEPPAPEPPAPELPAPAPPAPEPSAPVPPLLSLSATALSVQAGGEVSCELRIQNPGQTGDAYVLEPAGQAASWASVQPSMLSIAPGTAGTARLTFRPDASAPTGALPFEVRVRATQLPAQPVSAQGVLEIASPAPQDALSAGLSPQVSRGRTSADHTLSLANSLGVPVSATVSASDPDGFLAFDVEPPTLSLPPGAVSSVNVGLRARKRMFFRKEKPHPFQVLVVPEGGSPVSLGGTFVQERYVPLILMPVAGLFLVILAIAGLLVLLVAFLILKYVVFN
jgi:hypothetical protein